MKANWTLCLSIVLIACGKEPLTTLGSRASDPSAAPLLINEAAPRGTEAEGGIAADWIELRAGAQGLVIGANEWYVSDDPRDPLRSALPAMELPAGSFLVVRCDDAPEENDGALHVGFKLSSEGEHVTLVHRVGDHINIVDVVDLLPQEHGHGTQGRVAGASPVWVPLEDATPGASNATTATSAGME
jgi:hypothetical protein